MGTIHRAKVIVLIGGISVGSLNRRFFAAVEQLAAPGGSPGSDAAPGLEFTVFDIASLPFYSQDLEAAPPANVLALKNLAAESDAVLIVTPEYNRSIPGVLKNALDWGSRPVGNPVGNPASPATPANVWAHKPTAIMGASTGAIGTFGAQQHLRGICSHLDMPVMNQPAVYFNAPTGMTDASGIPTAQGDRLTESSAKFLRGFLTAFENWIALFPPK